MHAIRKGQIRWLGKGDGVGQRQFIQALKAIAPTSRSVSPGRNLITQMPHEHSSDCIGEEFAQSLYCLFAVALMCSIAIGPGEALV
jgi:hypothetical protein